MSFEFDLVVIGGGAAGLTSSGIAANVGVKTMMIEKDKLGGDCTWTGCVPSKTLIKSASVLHNIKNASSYGLDIHINGSNTGRVLEHIDMIRREVYEDADRPEIFEQMGIEVVSGEASFFDDHTIHIELPNGRNRRVTARYIFICTGAKALIPPIPGIHDIEVLTNESLFEIGHLPEKLIMIGAGPIGTEMAQAFNRLGTNVDVIDVAPRILMKDDPELTTILLKSLQDEGITWHLESSVQRIEKNETGVSVVFHKDGIEHNVDGGRLFVAAGRKANIDALHLDAAGIDTWEGGINVNDQCRTNRKHIYAIGDVTGLYQFTHMSEHMAKVAAANAFLKFPMKIDKKHVPRVTFTDPELGHIGASENELRERGMTFEVYRFPFSKIDRAITDGNTTGLIKVFAKKWNGKILGSSVLGAHAGEMISQYVLAMKNGISLKKFADTIHPYPTYGLGARRAADQWYIKNQSEGVVKWIKRIFRYKGDIPDYSDRNRIV